MSDSAALRVRDMSVSFGGVHALSDVAFSIPAGRVHGIIGPNGSGKTTVLNGLCGFVDASGRMELHGRELARLAPHRRMAAGLGRTFQNPRVDHALSVRDVLRLGGHLRRELPWWMVTFAPLRADRSLRRSAERAETLLAAVGLSGAILDRRLSSLSAGVVKMVDIVRALLAGPRVLLLDEPTSGMNETEIEALAAALERIRADGATVVVVEHHLRFVSTVCDGLTALEGGVVIAEGPPGEVLSSDAVTRAYLGTAGVAAAAE